MIYYYFMHVHNILYFFLFMHVLETGFEINNIETGLIIK